MTIPNLRVPIFAVEFDNSQAEQGPALLKYRVLMIGQKTSGGTAAADSFPIVTSADQVATLAGRGSMLHRMARAWYAKNKATALQIGVLADNGAGVAATSTVTFATTASSAGTWSFYIAGELVQVGVASGDTATLQAAALVTAIAANPNLPVTAANTAGVVTLTAKNKGTCGNDIDVRLNYQGAAELAAQPSATTCAIVAMTSGATNPTLTGLIAAIGDSWFNVIVNPYTDATSLSALETELASRAGPTRMIPGLAIAAKNATVSALATLGTGRNSQFSTITATQNSPTPTFEAAARIAAVAAASAEIDPARPFQTLDTGILAPAEADLFTLEERNTLLFDGISSLKVAAGGSVQIERLITTYQTNAAGTADASYLDATRPLTLSYLSYSLRARFAQKYPRHKLADDGARFGAGQAVMTPSLAKTECVLWFRDMEELGLVEKADQFKRDLVVARDGTDRTRLNFTIPPDLVDGYVGSAATILFR